MAKLFIKKTNKKTADIWFFETKQIFMKYRGKMHIPATLFSISGDNDGTCKKVIHTYITSI